MEDTSTTATVQFIFFLLIISTAHRANSRHAVDRISVRHGSHNWMWPRSYMSLH